MAPSQEYLALQHAAQIGRQKGRRWAAARLATARFGYHLPNTKAGLNMLTVMLAAGIPLIEVAPRAAKWIKPRDLRKAIAFVDAALPGYWTGTRLGDLAQLTDEERERLRLWCFRPYDVPWSVVVDRRVKSRKERNRIGARKRREKKRRCLTMETREGFLLAALAIDHEWVPVSKLVALAKGHPLWHGRSYVVLTKEGPTFPRRQKERAALVTKIHRWLDRLAARKQIQSKVVRGPLFNGDSVRYVRLRREKKREFGGNVVAFPTPKGGHNIVTPSNPQETRMK